jgi:hypothetical protein
LSRYQVVPFAEHSLTEEEHDKAIIAGLHRYILLSSAVAIAIAVAVTVAVAVGIAVVVAVG